MINIQRFEAVEIQVPTGSVATRFYFPDLPNLRNAEITAVEVYTSNNIGCSPLTGQTVVATADLIKSLLTLYQGDLQLVYNIPLIRLNEINNTTTNNNVFQLPKVANMTVSWVKSFVQLFTTLGTTNVVYCFGIFYKFASDGNNMSNVTNNS